MTTAPDAPNRLTRTPEIEPLVVPPEERAANLVDLVHRAVRRDPGKEAMRWKPPKSRGTDETAGESRIPILRSWLPIRKPGVSRASTKAVMPSRPRERSTVPKTT